MKLVHPSFGLWRNSCLQGSSQESKTSFDVSSKAAVLASDYNVHISLQQTWGSLRNNYISSDTYLHYSATCHKK